VRREGRAFVSEDIVEGTRQGVQNGRHRVQTIVQRLGGTPEDSVSATGRLHRRWTELKATLTGKSEQAVLDECERGEDVAKKSYKEALENQVLPPDIRAVVERQYHLVLRNHNQVKALRDADKRAR
jgi:uncharacterized protein (TIGR02284 family)